MAAKTATPRAGQVRRFVELDAMNLFLNNVAVETEFFGVDDDVIVEGLEELMRALWPGGDEEEQASVEYHLAVAERDVLYQRMMLWIVDEDGQQFCAMEARRFSQFAEDAARTARGLMPDA
jgi:hypothetical protein